jgi:nuclear transport factor 2 (NTF2) superfamily protein
MTDRPPLPPFDLEAALTKVQAAEDAWNTRDRIAVRFQYECHDASGQWWRSYGNELWEFDEHGLMRRREASINDVRIEASQRRIFGPRPAGEHGIELPVR